MSEKKPVGRPETEDRLKRVGMSLMVTEQNKKELKHKLQVIANKLDAQLNAEKKVKLNSH